MHIPTVLTSLPTWPAAAPPTTTTAITASSTLPCNGHPSLCARQYSNISFIGTHNSAFVGSLHDPRVNQQLSMTAQLDAGIRFLQAQTHVLEPLGQVKMCHTHCYIKDAGSLESYLTTVRTWMEAKGHEREVITLLLVNGDGADVSKFGEVFETTGLAKFAFTPATSSQKLDMQAWPTLGSMIDAGTRLVVFLDARADTLSVPYILDEVRYPPSPLPTLPKLTRKTVHLSLRDPLPLHHLLRARPPRPRHGGGEDVPHEPLRRRRVPWDCYAG